MAYVQYVEMINMLIAIFEAFMRLMIALYHNGPCAGLVTSQNITVIIFLAHGNWKDYNSNNF